ncbi:MAG: nitronate monooxygenase [Fimbriimonas sp.]|nr:nitronate monooxygenase [Fimbriimonas sp.]
MGFPLIIQGGMGVAVSNWRLARAVSLSGQLGVVSGTGLDAVLTRRLQSGDPDGQMRFALDHFPIKEMAERVWERYFVEGGKKINKAFKSKPVASQHSPKALLELTVVANFVEIFLAKHGHNGPVGINLLEKIQLPTLPSLFGAMLAKVDYVLMGAGIPRAIPGILDRFATLQPAHQKLDVVGAKAGEEFLVEFHPKDFVPEGTMELLRPKFLAIIASATLAITLVKKGSGRVDGFVVEGPTAGGHNAPPRGAMHLSDSGEPVYGPRDVPDLKEIADLGLPFWLAGSYAEPHKLKEALALGAAGIQAGTVFAFCNESGIDAEIKRQVIEQSLTGKLSVFTDPLASPTGFPFKVLQLEGSLADADVFEQRDRICDLGYLRQSYRKEDGTIGYRCPAEPLEDYVAKGGKIEETDSRKCVCNGLFSTVGYPQRRKDGKFEPALITAGDDIENLSKVIPAGQNTYSAADVIAYLLGE